MTPGTSTSTEPVAEPDSQQPQTSLTVYSSADPRAFDPQDIVSRQRAAYDAIHAGQIPGFGLVRQTRPLELKAGTSEVLFTDVASFIDPTTVRFDDLTDPSTTVLEQSFQFDLVSPAKLYEKHLGRVVTVEVAMGQAVVSVRGTLLAFDRAEFVLQTAEGVRVLPAERAQVQLGELPGGLLTRPTLVWKLDAGSGGTHQVRTTYRTGCMTWRADYTLLLDESDTSADLSAWVTLLNMSGASFKGAQLKLVAGDTHQVTPRGSYPVAMMRAEVQDLSPGFQEKPLFEYHLYTLPRTTDVLANTSLQIALFPPKPAVKVEKLLVLPRWWDGWSSPEPMLDRNWGVGQQQKVGVFIRLENTEDDGLGLPLPRGKIRVFKRDVADGNPEFVGEDVIDHTPHNGIVVIKLGDAFDLTAERTQTDFTVDTVRRTMSESWRIVLKSGKTQDQVVEVREPLSRWIQWELVRKNLEFTRLDARSVCFKPTVPARGEAVVEYTVRYTW